MGFWDTFVKVWQVRTSIRIQDSIESGVLRANEEKELRMNLPRIVQELNRKNTVWEEEIERQRNKKT